MISWKKHLETSVLGMVRGTLVQLLIHPLQNIKTCLQASSAETTSSQIIRKILEQKGIFGFYSGLKPKLIDTNIKQFWVWPFLQAAPRFLEQKKVTPLSAQIVTGVSIATIDACLSTPFEGAKIRLILAEKSPFSLFKGFKANWTRLTVQWTTFLAAQRYFRNQYKKTEQDSLTYPQLIMAGIKTACVVSVASAPFDTANTLVHISQSIFNRPLRHLYRGWPYSALALLIHNIASVTLLDHLEQSNRFSIR